MRASTRYKLLGLDALLVILFASNVNSPVNPALVICAGFVLGVTFRQYYEAGKRAGRGDE